MDHFIHNYDGFIDGHDNYTQIPGDAPLQQNPGRGPQTEIQKAFQILNWLQLVHVPFIVVSNTVVIVTFVLLKRLKTPDNYIIAGLAFADLNTAFWNIPIQIIGYHPETSAILKETYAACVFRFSIPTLWNSTSLSLLMLLTIDRYLAILKPFCYIQHVTRGCVLTIMFLVFGLEALRCIVLWGSLLTYDENIKNPHARCLYSNTPVWYSYFVFIKLGIQITSAFLCTGIVAVVSFKRLRETYKLPKQMQIFETGQAKRQVNQVKTTIILMFLFFILWLPTLGIPFAFKLYSRDKALLYFMITNHLRLLNCSVNAVVYALSKKVYKKSYKFLLTHWPCHWRRISVSMREATYPLRAHDTGTTRIHSSYRPTSAPSPSLTSFSEPDLKELFDLPLEAPSSMQVFKLTSRSPRSTLKIQSSINHFTSTS